MVVAGSANTTADKLHTKYRRRLDVAVGLLGKNPALKVLVTGGVKTGHKVSEAANAKTYLLSKGIAASRILVEDKSGSTAGNMTYGLPIAAKANAESLIIVSDLSHSRRCLAFAYAAAKKLSLNLPISGADWYADSVTQDATVSQTVTQAKSVWSKMTTGIVTGLDAKWGVDAFRADGTTVYTVVKGDTLYSIAKKLLGDGNRYPEIVKASSLSGTLITPGQKLTIPTK